MSKEVQDRFLPDLGSHANRCQNCGYIYSTHQPHESGMWQRFYCPQLKKKVDRDE